MYDKTELREPMEIVQEAYRKATREQIVYLLSCFIGGAIAVLVALL